MNPEGLKLELERVSYKRVKYILQGVVAELDADGNIVGESTTQQVAVYTKEQLQEFIDKFDSDINEANASMNGAGPE